VKDEITNLTIMATTLHSIINHGPLKKFKAYEDICFEHVMFEVCQYATNDNKVFIQLKNVSERNLS
jgi:hypothetical protein